jgi:hypothetical protein
VYEAAGVDAKFNADLTEAIYPARAAVEEKTVRFVDDGVEVEIAHSGKFVEQIPLLRPDDITSIYRTTRG